MYTIYILNMEHPNADPVIGPNRKKIAYKICISMMAYIDDGLYDDG